MEIVHLMQELEITHVHVIMGLWVQRVTLKTFVLPIHVVATENVIKHKTVYTMYASVIRVTKETNVRQLITAHQLPVSTVEVVRM